MTDTTPHVSYINWTFNGLLHKAVIGNGLLTLLVLPFDLQKPSDGRWRWQINGAKPLTMKQEPMTLDAAKHAVESYAVMVCRSMISELT